MKIKTGLALLGVMTLLGGSLLLANNQVQETKATDTTVGFESSEGFVANDVYNNTSLYSTGNAGYKWSTYFGCPSIGSQTIPPISGEQSLQLRYYTFAAEAGYSYMEYKVSGIQKVTFKAYSTEALTLKVYQSTSIGESFTNPSSYILTSEVATYTYTITGTSDISLKFEMDIAVAPANKAKIIFDDVTFVTKSSDPTISLDKTDVITYNYEHDITFTSSVENMKGEITYEWSIVSDPDNCITLVDSATSNQTISIASKFGEATIKVYALDSEANDAEASATITIRECVTVNKLITDGTDDTTYYIQGYISKDNTSNSIYSYNILNSTAGTDVNNVTSLVIFSGSNNLNLKVGDFIVIEGKLLTYNGERRLGSVSIKEKEYSVDHLVDIIFSSDTVNQCSFKYLMAKNHYNALSEAEKTIFNTSEDELIKDARERYNAWKVNQEDSSSTSTSSISSNVAIIIITFVGILGITTAGIILIIKKKKETF